MATTPLPAPAATPTRTCRGPCGRLLPLDVEHFYRRSDGASGGFTAQCRECFKAAARARDTAARERRRAERPKTKRCTSICGRELPIGAEHFHQNRSNWDGFDSRCRDCKNAEAQERRDADRAARERARQRAERERQEAEAESQPPPTRVFHDRRTPEGRRELIRSRIAATPGHAADAAERARRLMAAGDRAVESLMRPPFDANEVLVDLAGQASQDAPGAGFAALTMALRRIEWSPEWV